ncbi:MAG: hypothetical protein HOM34_01110 [Planctomycetes bacterium]|jgi:hypothetical protein|nr:hypothetical protein [Planctomycetota bacterium]MBT4028363.1 hypothetical protein [Planctomycetota bacterium]MBT4561037.1 hypothetical protein [Planctomycetota bacterium]MBT5101256.1 hypothetical protein [Planctomycetota bacterium]MBT5119301.1 hypothetical protein [Planctomycetota bacterium]
MSKPRPTLEWLHVCDYAFRDEQGKVGMIGLFDTLASAKLPGRLPMFCVAFGVTDGVGEYNMGLQVIAPSGKVVDLKLPPIQLHNKKQKARAVLRLAGMPFEEYGQYVFRLVIEGSPVAAPVHALDHVEPPKQPGQGAGPGGSALGSIPPPPDFRQN